MTRALGWFNLLGVLVLSGLCVIQWRTNRQLNREVIALEKVRLAQEESLYAQARDLAGTRSDLERFREQLTLSATLAQEARDAVKSLEPQVARLTTERDHLQEGIRQWREAVQLRDSRLEEAAEQLQRLVRERDDVITRFNELAERHGKLVAELDAERTRAAVSQTK